MSTKSEEGEMKEARRPEEAVECPGGSGQDVRSVDVAESSGISNSQPSDPKAVSLKHGNSGHSTASSMKETLSKRQRELESPSSIPSKRLRPDDAEFAKDINNSEDNVSPTGSLSSSLSQHMDVDHVEPDIDHLGHNSNSERHQNRSGSEPEECQHQPPVPILVGKPETSAQKPTCGELSTTEIETAEESVQQTAKSQADRINSGQIDVIKGPLQIKASRPRKTSLSKESMGQDLSEARLPEETLESKTDTLQDPNAKRLPEGVSETDRTFKSVSHEKGRMPKISVVYTPSKIGKSKEHCESKDEADHDGSHKSSSKLSQCPDLTENAGLAEKVNARMDAQYQAMQKKPNPSACDKLSLFGCKKCGCFFRSETVLGHHLQVCQGAIFCKSCRVTFAYRGAESNIIPRACVCKHCGRSFSPECWQREGKNAFSCEIFTYKCDPITKAVDHQKNCSLLKGFLSVVSDYNTCKCNKKINEIVFLTRLDNRGKRPAAETVESTIMSEPWTFAIKCATCNTLFRTVRELLVHLMIGQQNGLLRCFPLVDKKLQLKNENFHFHLCVVCNTIFLREGDLQRHVCIVDRSKAALAIKKIAGFIAAQKMVHSTADKNDATCQQMPMKYEDERIRGRSLDDHTYSGQPLYQPFLCEVCGSSFPVLVALEEHAKEHVLEESNVTPQKLFAISDAYNWNVGRAAHNKDTILQKGSFLSRNEPLPDSCMVHEPYEGENSSLCHHCGLLFEERVELLRHLAKHSIGKHPANTDKTATGSDSKHPVILNSSSLLVNPKCLKCGLKCRTVPSLQKHLKKCLLRKDNKSQTLDHSPARISKPKTLVQRANKSPTKPLCRHTKESKQKNSPQNAKGSKPPKVLKNAQNSKPKKMLRNGKDPKKKKILRHAKDSTSKPLIQDGNDSTTEPLPQHINDTIDLPQHETRFKCRLCPKTFSLESQHLRHKKLHRLDSRRPVIDLTQLDLDNTEESTNSTRKQRKKAVKKKKLEKRKEEKKKKEKTYGWVLKIHGSPDASESGRRGGTGREQEEGPQSAHEQSIKSSSGGRDGKSAGTGQSSFVLAANFNPVLDRRFPCGLCGKWFSSHAELETHMVVHSGLNCNRCEEATFASSAEMIRHLLKHSEKQKKNGSSKSLATNSSSTARDSKSQLNTLLSADAPVPRMTAGFEKRAFSCDLCGKVFSRKAQLKFHMVVHSDISCVLCDGLSFASSEELKSHLETHLEQASFVKHEKDKPSAPRGNTKSPSKVKSGGAREEPQKIVRQNKEGPKSSVRKGKKDSKSKVVKKHYCSVCNRGFPRPWRLRKHMVVHDSEHEEAPETVKNGGNGSKSSVPKVCVESSVAEDLKSVQSRQSKASKKSLKVTELTSVSSEQSSVSMTHAELDKQFSCLLCGKGFSDLTQLKIHKASVHSEFNCDQCYGVKFRSSEQLSLHMLTHTQQFKCTMCDAVYASQKSLSDHIIASHSDQVPHICHICSSVFYSQKSLKMHQIMEHSAAKMKNIIETKEKESKRKKEPVKKKSKLRKKRTKPK